MAVINVKPYLTPSLLLHKYVCGSAALPGGEKSAQKHTKLPDQNETEACLVSSLSTSYLATLQDRNVRRPGHGSVLSDAWGLNLGCTG